MSFITVERIKVDSRRDKRMEFIAESQRQADTIAKEHNAKTKANRERARQHGTTKST